MDDPELEAIKQKRMAELQRQQGGAGGGGGSQPQQQQKQQEAAAREEEMRNMILGQVLEQNARARLGTIKAANESKGRQLENMIVQMARMGRIQGKLSDDRLKQLLEEINVQTKSSGVKVHFDRQRAAIDSDSD